MNFCPLCGSNVMGSSNHRCSIKNAEGDWEQIEPRLYLRQIIVEAEFRGGLSERARWLRAAGIRDGSLSIEEVLSIVHDQAVPKDGSHLSEWTHTICDECWKRRSPGREPVRVSSVCCFCGKYHRSGAYVREDPVLPRCGGAGPEH